MVANGTASAAVVVPAARPAEQLGHLASASGPESAATAARPSPARRCPGKERARPPGRAPRPPRRPHGRRLRRRRGLGHQQSGAADLGGERAPQPGVVGLVRLGPGQHGRPVSLVLRAPTGPRRAARSPPRCRSGRAGAPPCTRRRGRRSRRSLTHRGRSFHGTFLSTRISGGSPSTRSAMMLRRISDVPPSIELPLDRRYR